MNKKKIIGFLIVTFLGCASFAQTFVEDSKLGKTLDKNKDAAASYETAASLDGFSLSENIITIPSIVTKSVLECEFETEALNERISRAGKSAYKITIKSKDVLGKTKVYSVTKIEGLETVEEYKSNLIVEARQRYEKERYANLTSSPVAVISSELENIEGDEKLWLPGQVRDKLKANLQQYAGMKTVVDAQAEKSLIAAQKQTAGLGHDEENTIEYGKITNAAFAVFSTVRKTGAGYTISADVTDLVTGEHMVSAASIEYKKIEELYESAGAVDEVTVKLAEKLGLTLNKEAKNLLVSGAPDFETKEEYKAYLAELARLEKERYEAERFANLTGKNILVMSSDLIGVTGSESSWLAGQIKDSILGNLKSYLGMKAVSNTREETAVKNAKANSQEYKDLTDAAFVVFSSVRKTGANYVLTVQFVDVKTGEQLDSATSKTYSKADYLYSKTGAVDEITLHLADSLGLLVSDEKKKFLAEGEGSLSVEEQLKVAQENEASYLKQQANLDAEIAILSQSTDLSAAENRKKLEAEKALLVEKQNAEKKRQQELAEQKSRAEADAKFEAERSIALKTQRDQMAKEAAAKAAEVRKLKMEKQGVLGQINVIESKKKALVEIRQGVEERSVELYEQMLEDKQNEEQRIRSKSYSMAELGSDDLPTEQARQRRENQIIKSNEDLTNKFFNDCEAVKTATMPQQNSLLAEIRNDQKNLASTRTVSSMGEELKVSYGKYEGSKNGWNVYLSLYSDGILLYTDSFIVNYEALSGKKAPDMATELNDAVIDEYINNVDMYNSLLTRGDPIIYFELDYNVTPESDDKPSQYKFNFSKIRVLNTVSGKVTQTSSLDKIQPRTMNPEWDLREIVGIVEKEKAEFAPEKYPVEVYRVKGQSLENAKKLVERDKLLNSLGMVNIPGKNIKMLNTEVTQKLYASVMGDNPSYYKDENNPVEQVDWYDAIYFCNKLSMKYGFEPVYSINGTTDVSKWNSIKGGITQNTNANGFRLPTVEEWNYAARSEQNYTYSGSDNLDEVGWYDKNSGGKTHPVAQKKANGYGLYDMSGNVWEWCWDIYHHAGTTADYRYRCGGSYYRNDYYCKVVSRHYDGAYYQHDNLGFRIVCNAN